MARRLRSISSAACTVCPRQFADIKVISLDSATLQYGDLLEVFEARKRRFDVNHLAEKDASCRGAAKLYPSGNPGSARVAPLFVLFITFSPHTFRRFPFTLTPPRLQPAHSDQLPSGQRRSREKRLRQPPPLTYQYD